MTNIIRRAFPTTSKSALVAISHTAYITLLCSSKTHHIRSMVLHYAYGRERTKSERRRFAI